MFRVTTPTIDIELTNDSTVSLTTAKEVEITIKQIFNDATIVKNLSDGDVAVSEDGKHMAITLTQEETQKLSPGEAYIQIRVKTKDDAVITHEALPITISESLSENIL